jgi:hypothetical protein
MTNTNSKSNAPEIDTVYLKGLVKFFNAVINRMEPEYPSLIQSIPVYSYTFGTVNKRRCYSECWKPTEFSISTFNKLLFIAFDVAIKDNTKLEFLSNKYKEDFKNFVKHQKTTNKPEAKNQNFLSFIESATPVVVVSDQVKEILQTKNRTYFKREYGYYVSTTLVFNLQSSSISYLFKSLIEDDLLLKESNNNYFKITSYLKSYKTLDLFVKEVKSELLYYKLKKTKKEQE